MIRYFTLKMGQGKKVQKQLCIGITKHFSKEETENQQCVN